MQSAQCRADREAKDFEGNVEQPQHWDHCRIIALRLPAVRSHDLRYDRYRCSGPGRRAWRSFTKRCHHCFLSPGTKQTYQAAASSVTGDPFSSRSRSIVSMANSSWNSHSMLVFFRFFHNVRLSRQLKHSGTLAGTEPGQQHDLTIGKLQSVVMHVRIAQID